MPDLDNPADFTTLPDLAGRPLGGAVIAANDELFAAKENLLSAAAAVFQPHTFGPRGQIYDGWETRRRREPGVDWAVVRLGASGVLRGAIVDTAFFTGNYPEQASLHAATVPGYPSVDEVLDESVEWTELLPPSDLRGDAANPFPIDVERRFTHVKLTIHPDGGVARLRLHGAVVPDPAWFAGRPLDLASVVNGGTIAGCSNSFYSTPGNLLLPSDARVMGEGWETARRRDDGNDWVSVRLAEEGLAHQVEIDTTHFVGNAPGWFTLTAEGTDGDLIELLPRTRLQPDTRQRFQVSGPPIRQVRLDVYPDGGLARFRVFGELTPAGMERMTQNWDATA